MRVSPPVNTYRQPGISAPPLALLALLVVTLAIIVFVGIYLITAKSINVVIDGVRSTVRTHQVDVAGLIAELGILIEPPDNVMPTGDTKLVNGLLVTVDNAEPVLVEVDGQRRRLLTHLMQPREILAEAQITIKPYDQVYVDGLPIVNQMYTRTPESLYVLRAFRVTLVEGKQAKSFETVARTVGEALAEANVSLYLADHVMPATESPLADGDIITIERSVTVHIEVDGRVLTTRTSGKTVKAVLAEAGLPIVGQDYTLPDENAPVTPGMRIQIVRVTTEIQIEQVEIPFQQVMRPDDKIPPETQQVIQIGMPGLLERRTRVRMENGVVISRSAPQEVLIRPPQDEVIAVGATPSLIKP